MQSTAIVSGLQFFPFDQKRWFFFKVLKILSFEWCLVPHIDFRLINCEKPVLKKNCTGSPATHSRYMPKIGDAPDQDGDLKLSNHTLPLIWHSFQFILTALISDSIKCSDFFEDPPPIICFPDIQSSEYIHYCKIFQAYPVFWTLC